MFLPNDIYSNKHKRSDGIRLQSDGEGVVKLLNDDGMIMADDEKPTSVAGLYRLYQRESSYQTMLYQHHQQRHHPNKQIMNHPSNDSLSAASTMMLSSDSTSTTIPEENLSPRGEATSVYPNETLPATVSSDEEDDNEVANDEKLAEFAIAMARRMREKHCPAITRRGSVYLDDVIYSSPPSSSTIASVELFGDFIIGMADEASSLSSSSSSSTVTSKQRTIFSLEEKSAAALFKVDALHRNGIRAIDTAMPTVVDLDLSPDDMYDNDNDSFTVSPTYSTTEGSRNHVSPFRGPKRQQNTRPPSIDNSHKKTKSDDIVPQLTLEECTSFESSSSSSTISPSSLIKSPAHVNLVTTLPSVRADVVKTQFQFDAAGMSSSTGLHPSTTKKGRHAIVVIIALCIGIFGLHHIDSIVTQQPTTFGIVPAVIEPSHSAIDILIMASNLANDYEKAASSMSLVSMNENDSHSTTTIGTTTSLFCGGDSRPGDMSVELWNMINI